MRIANKIYGIFFIATLALIGGCAATTAKKSAIIYNDFAQILGFSEQKFTLECSDLKSGFNAKKATKSYALFVNGNFRFILMDASLVVVLDRTLSEQGFKNNKFLPPNTSFDEIFYGVLEMIKNDKKSAILGACKVSAI